jgi:hypothetical protein
LPGLLDVFAFMIGVVQFPIEEAISLQVFFEVIFLNRPLSPIYRFCQDLAVEAVVFLNCKACHSARGFI